MKKKEREESPTIADLGEMFTRCVFPVCLSLKKDTFADRIVVIVGNLDSILRLHKERGKPTNNIIKIKFCDEGERNHIDIIIKVTNKEDVILSYQEYCVFTKSKSLLKKWAKELIEQIEELKEKYGDEDTDDEEEDEDE